MLRNRDLLKGLFLVAVALAFGLNSFRYPLGGIDNAGPGLFPLVMSCSLLIIGVATIIRCRWRPNVELKYQVRHIGFLVASLIAFGVVSAYVNMIAGIVALVFVASLAASSYSIVRNVKIVIGLVAVAFAFKMLLGLQLPLY